MYQFKWKETIQRKSKKCPKEVVFSESEFEEFKRTIPLKIASIESIRQTVRHMDSLGFNIYDKEDYKKLRISRVYSTMEKISKNTAQPIEKIINDFAKKK